MAESVAPPAGWYPDSQNAAQSRYWDGAGWTDHVALQATGPHAPSPGAAQPTKKGLSTGAIVAISVGGGVVLILAILAAITIPVFNNQKAKAVDAAAKSEVTSLGLELATYFVDHDGPAPQIVQVDGSYAFEDGTPMAREPMVSPHVTFGGQTGESWDDWCVWVVGTGGDVKEFEYSSANGLRHGRCGE